MRLDAAERPVAAITGASSGIGAEFANQLAATHDLILIARRTDRLEQLAAAVQTQHGTDVRIITADLTVSGDLACVAGLISTEHRLALLVNSAGYGAEGYFWELPAESEQRMHDLHVSATIRLTHAALQKMVQQDSGAVINVASISAWLRRPGFICYAATKSWMTAFTEGLYLNLLDAGSHVNVQALCPGLVYTEFHDRMKVKRSDLGGRRLWHTPKEVVRASLRGLRRKQLFVVPGWRYRILMNVIWILPPAIKMHVQARIMRGRGSALHRRQEHVDNAH
jgi:short-subunit dehydrogenase